MRAEVPGNWRLREAVTAQPSPEVLARLRAALSSQPAPPGCPRCQLPFGLVEDEDGGFKANLRGVANDETVGDWMVRLMNDDRPATAGNRAQRLGRHRSGRR